MNLIDGGDERGSHNTKHRPVELPEIFPAAREDQYAFEEMKLICVQLLQLYTDKQNEKSGAAILRLGAKQEGILRKARIMPDGRVRTTVVFSIIDDEWPGVKRDLEQKLRVGGVEPVMTIDQP